MLDEDFRIRIDSQKLKAEVETIKCKLKNFI